MEKVEKQTEDLAGKTPEKSPFATPLDEDAGDVLGCGQRKRIRAAVLGAIQDEVLPAYVRFAKFLQVVGDSRRAQGARGVGDEGWRRVLRLLRAAVDDAGQDAGGDPSDRARRGEARRGGDAGDRAEAGLQGCEELWVAMARTRSSTRRPPRVCWTCTARTRRDEAEAAGAVWPACRRRRSRWWRCRRTWARTRRRRGMRRSANRGWFGPAA